MTAQQGHYGRVHINGPQPHRHLLPEQPEAEGLRPGAVVECASCGRLFLLDPIPWERTWVPLRWWHFRARRAVRWGHW